MSKSLSVDVSFIKLSMMSDPDSSSEQSVLAASLKSFSEVFRWVLKNILLWLLEKEQKEICDVDNGKLGKYCKTA